MQRAGIHGLLLILFLAGCAGSAPTRFYLLDSQAPAARAETSGDVVLGVEPVAVPDYLDRPDIVTRTAGHRLDLAEFDRWAERLDTNVARVLADGLAAQLPTHRVVLLANQPIETDFTLRLHLDRFERQANGEVLLAASWIVEEGASGAPLMIRSASIRETVGADSYDAIVAAMSRALDRLSLRIGAEVEGLQPADRDT